MKSLFKKTMLSTLVLSQVFFPLAKADTTETDVYSLENIDVKMNECSRLDYSINGRLDSSFSVDVLDREKRASVKMGAISTNDLQQTVTSWDTALAATRESMQQLTSTLKPLAEAGDSDLTTNILQIIGQSSVALFKDVRNSSSKVQFGGAIRLLSILPQGYQESENPACGLRIIDGRIQFSNDPESLKFKTEYLVKLPKTMVIKKRISLPDQGKITGFQVNAPTTGTYSHYLIVKVVGDVNFKSGKVDLSVKIGANYKAAEFTGDNSVRIVTGSETMVSKVPQLWPDAFSVTNPNDRYLDGNSPVMNTINNTPVLSTVVPVLTTVWNAEIDAAKWGRQKIANLFTVDVQKEETTSKPNSSQVVKAEEPTITGFLMEKLSEASVALQGPAEFVRDLTVGIAGLKNIKNSTDQGNAEVFRSWFRSSTKICLENQTYGPLINLAHIPMTTSLQNAAKKLGAYDLRMASGRARIDTLQLQLSWDDQKALEPQVQILDMDIQAFPTHMSWTKENDNSMLYVLDIGDRNCIALPRGKELTIMRGINSNLQSFLSDKWPRYSQLIGFLKANMPSASLQPVKVDLLNEVSPAPNDEIPAPSEKGK